MRVIAGSAKRLRLKTLEGLETRPTSDRIKETLFNMISPWIADCKFLDLFAGSGGIGIEALSRGAKRAVFVEKNPKAAEIIKENLRFTKLSDKSQVIVSDVQSVIHRLGSEKFDYIFMDPPYDQNLERTALEAIARQKLLEDDGVAIVEASLETNFDYLEEIGLSMIKEKIYKTNKHVFIEYANGGDAA